MGSLEKDDIENVCSKYSSTVYYQMFKFNQILGRHCFSLHVVLTLRNGAFPHFVV